MATKAYFRHFPIIEYGSKVARNIIARPRLKESILNNPLAFYKYVIEHDMRPDQVAARYYDDPELVWLIFLANDIVDPYHQWPLTQSQFDDLMAEKYGSLETARSTILHYKQVDPAKNNEETGTTISKETYELHTGGTVPVLTGVTKQVTPSTYLPVYAYNYEEELNDAKREIRLVDYRMANKAAELLRKAMNE